MKDKIIKIFSKIIAGLGGVTFIALIYFIIWFISFWTYKLIF